MILPACFLFSAFVTARGSHFLLVVALIKLNYHRTPTGILSRNSVGGQAGVNFAGKRTRKKFLEMLFFFFFKIKKVLRISVRGEREDQRYC